MSKNEKNRRCWEQRLLFAMLAIAIRFPSEEKWVFQCHCHCHCITVHVQYLGLALTKNKFALINIDVYLYSILINMVVVVDFLPLNYDSLHCGLGCFHLIITVIIPVSYRQHHTRWWVECTITVNYCPTIIVSHALSNHNHNLTILVVIYPLPLTLFGGGKGKR